MRETLHATILMFVFCACAHPQPAPVRADPSPAAATPSEAIPAEVGPGLAFEVEPTDAEVIIDGKSYGKVSALPLQAGVLPLPAGVYQVSLKHPQRATWRAEVSVGQRVEKVKVELQPR